MYYILQVHCYCYLLCAVQHTDLNSPTPSGFALIKKWSLLLRPQLLEPTHRIEYQWRRILFIELNNARYWQWSHPARNSKPEWVPSYRHALFFIVFKSLITSKKREKHQGVVVEPCVAEGIKKITHCKINTCPVRGSGNPTLVHSQTYHLSLQHTVLYMQLKNLE